MRVITAFATPSLSGHDLLPFVLLGSARQGTWERDISGVPFDISNDYGHDPRWGGSWGSSKCDKTLDDRESGCWRNGNWFVRCNVPLIGPGTRGLIIFGTRGMGSRIWVG